MPLEGGNYKIFTTLESGGKAIGSNFHGGPFAPVIVDGQLTIWEVEPVEGLEGVYRFLNNGPCGVQDRDGYGPVPVVISTHTPPTLWEVTEANEGEYVVQLADVERSPVQKVWTVVEFQSKSLVELRPKKSDDGKDKAQVFQFKALPKD
ncbi:hypothetical protein NP233_g9388 [Leucocoprinus birnbaumii]|uniref:Uncharacterized protein n=1 Tax=Leucocoprinus birnbaumii TaxID=56174 RepID=A0AAD5VKG3_9AGAR|nr:hypothetical protein NP233_g9388 [Leucocoprinus birnbaumii]